MKIVLESDALKVNELINSKEVVLNELGSSLDDIDSFCSGVEVSFIMSVAKFTFYSEQRSGTHFPSLVIFACSFGVLI